MARRLRQHALIAAVSACAYLPPPPPPPPRVVAAPPPSRPAHLPATGVSVAAQTAAGTGMLAAGSVLLSLASPRRRARRHLLVARQQETA